MVVKIASACMLNPTAIPIAAATQTPAAVVKPFTRDSWKTIKPAPKNPTPVTICAAILVGSTFGPTKEEEIIENNADPKDTSA